MVHQIAEPYPLTNAYSKAEWAKGHLGSLEEAAKAFSENAYTITTEEELEQNQVRHRIRLEQPHVSVYLMCGDYLQCLRTALDQAVWSLIYHRTGIDSKSSEFPVFREPLNADTIRKFNTKTKGLSTPAIDYIKSIQPYNRPAGAPIGIDPLWRIHELNRIDKHRRIAVHTQVSFASQESYGPIIPLAGIADATDVSEERTDYGYDVVCRGAYKNLKPKISTFVIFGELAGGIFMDIEDLSQLHDFVTDEVLVSLASRL